MKNTIVVVIFFLLSTGTALAYICAPTPSTTPIEPTKEPTATPSATPTLQVNTQSDGKTDGRTDGRSDGGRSSDFEVQATIPPCAPGICIDK